MTVAPDPRRVFNRYRRRHERDRESAGNVLAVCIIATMILGGWLLERDDYFAAAAAFAVSLALFYLVGMLHLFRETPAWDELNQDEADQTD